jgi:hypothetical protein
MLLQPFSAGGTTNMMGIKHRSFAALPHNISLEELVPNASPDKTVVKAYPLKYETTNIRASLERRRA